MGMVRIMGLGAQRGTVTALVTFALWCKRNGYQVGEMHGFATVHNVHAKGSWHYDKENGHGKALDLNWPGGGNTERARLAAAVPVAQMLGLGVIYGRDGTNGPTRTHQGHLHADVGAYSNLGRGEVVTHTGGDVVTSGIQGAVHAHADQVWGPDTEQRTNAVRASTRHHGGTHPHVVTYTQAVIGTTTDGKWGPASSRAHDNAVKGIQVALKLRGFYGGAIDGVWGQGTETGFMNARDIRFRH
jgi:hypothetical protein